MVFRRTINFFLAASVLLLPGHLLAQQSKGALLLEAATAYLEEENDTIPFLIQEAIRLFESNGETDSLGRATFHYIPPDCDVRPTERELRWFKHIARHGPQSSVHLYEATRDTHRCRDTALRRMQKLRAGGYLVLPPQQRATERAECAPYVYDLTQKTRSYLSDLGLDEPTVRPTGHWWHAYLTACVTSSIDICASRSW